MESNEWSKLKGIRGEDAKALILNQRKDLKVHIVPQGAMVTMDYRMDRVRIFVDSNGVVTDVPRIG